jgi:hypothetical protein
MATISENISRINKAKTDIKNAIIAKGGSVADADKIDTYAQAIEALPSGGGTELPQNLSRFVTDDWGNPKKITIKGSVGTISDNAYQNGKLEEVIIGNGVTSIGENAFRDCYDLSSATIPDSVTSIGNMAFVSTKITSIVIPDSVTSIGKEAFYHCKSLRSVTIGNGVTSISDGAFRECDALTAITIPDSVTSIGEWAFYLCSALTAITIPDNVTSIGEWAFGDCSNLTNVTIPDSVTSIGRSAFSDCSNLTSVTIGKGVTNIGRDAFGSWGRRDFTITIKATTPPTLDEDIMDANSVTAIYVPSDSVDAYKSASGWSDYASKIQAIQE